MNEASYELTVISERQRRAHQMVVDLCHQKRHWIMSIPAQPDYDPDLVIGASLRDVHKLLEKIGLLRQALQALVIDSGEGTNHEAGIGSDDCGKFCIYCEFYDGNFDADVRHDANCPIVVGRDLLARIGEAT